MYLLTTLYHLHPPGCGGERRATQKPPKTLVFFLVSSFGPHLHCTLSPVLLFRNSTMKIVSALAFVPAVSAFMPATAPKFG